MRLGVLTLSLFRAFVAGNGEEVQILLDDMDGGAGITSANAFEGSYQPCMKDAYKGQFHHDWAKSKGSAHFSFTFEVPVSGCYKLEEYHPGASGNEMCSRYLPTNTRLDVDWCKGKSSTLFVNQAANGGQWNTIGEFPFFKGWPGKLKLSNSPKDNCYDRQSCFWVADAFRLTRVGSRCQSRPPPPLPPALPLPAAPTAQVTLTAAPNTMPTSTEKPISTTQQSEAQAVAWQKGSLRLTIGLSGGKAGSSVQASLIEQKDVIEATLKAELGAVAVELDAITPWSGQGRRLLDTGAIFQIDFRAQVDSPKDATMDGFKKSLQDAISSAGSSLKIQAAELAWTEPKTLTPTPEASKSEGDFPTVLLIGLFIGVKLAVYCWCAASSLWRQRKTQAVDEIEITPVESFSGEKQPETEPTKELEKNVDDDKKEAGIIDDNASTITPCSEENRSLPDERTAEPEP
eukprot:TRINITY_DN51125_c0_g1_i1.p1 TRINITY_DN51125_c0_g1~~TRINITY_DN51125_c0_g1_i1.p1  ORF type:complete len:459 (-),score=113.43 TRINITY_DN51125_c0_g1_i1:301-1677(-)